MEAYMTAPRMVDFEDPPFLPSLHQRPSMGQRSMTTLPWKPAMAYSLKTSSHPVPSNNMSSSLTQLDALKVPRMYTSARSSLMSRYTPQDWSVSNLGQFKAAEMARSGSEKLRVDATRLCVELDEKTTRTQMDVGKKLGERIGDIEFWKGEVLQETGSMVAETEALARAKGCLERVLAETQGPLATVQECLYAREKRRGIDLVHDAVEKMLIKEVGVIKDSQMRLEEMVQAANNQLSLNRAAKHELEKDADDKTVSLSLDGTCHHIKNSTRGIAYYNGIHRIDNTTSVPVTWAEFSAENVRRSKAERQASRQLREAIDLLVNKVSNDLTNQWQSVNSAFNDRLREYNDARNKLQMQLSRTLQEILDMERVIELLKKNIAEKEAPMQVAQTRLATRIRRPNVEACRDPVQHRLVEEVEEIHESTEQLRSKLREAEHALQHLLNTKLTLEHDLDYKNNSILIDREKCLSIRQGLPMATAISIY